ncbi:unnamed protein product [Adineta steineri]|uniref:Btz domain-containing protein n=1 Tax=Adineta steineri TaxID=433720 RepID=A0A813Z6B1_9BILA|nr:unnamed protein product [Adineta steineri]
MSESSQVCEIIINKNDQQQEETSLTNDESNMISITDEKTIIVENESESGKTTDDEYEDLEDDDDEEEETSISKRNLSKKTKNNDELHINIKPRRINQKRQDDEHSEGYEDDDDDDHQNVPKVIGDSKKSDKAKEILDDDNNTQSPAYIPRKGKFYEHDDRTLSENDRPKQNDNRFYKDSDGKWQHDLFYQDEQKSKSRHSLQNYNANHYERSYNGNGEQPRSNNFISRPYKRYTGYQQPQRYTSSYRQRLSHDNYNNSPKVPINSFDLKDYNRPLSYNRTGYNKDMTTTTTTTSKEAQVTSRQQRHDNNPLQIDERTFHRRRDFKNSQFQQQENGSKINTNFDRNDQKRFSEQINGNDRFKDNNEYYNQTRKNQQDFKKYELYENKNTLPPRFQTNNNNNNQTLIQKQQFQQKPSSNLSSDITNNDRPKRYSNMRNSMTNYNQQQTLSSQLQHYQDQRSNKLEQNDWPQAPSPPISFLPQQIITPQMFYQQQQQQQQSRYVPVNLSQMSISQQKNNMSIKNKIVGGPDQRRLLHYLFEENKYDPLERPVFNDTATLTVTMSLALQQIIDFDEKNEILVISGWLVLVWHDYNLQWKPEDFGGIQAIRVPSVRVWTPDIYLYNSADDNFEGTMKTNLVVQYNGSILFAPPGILKSICPFNIASFPFDEQNCTLKFGSWSFDESGVNLTSEGDQGQSDAYVKNAEWDLLNFTAVRNAFAYECCPTVYPFVLFTIHIRRRTLYYVVNIVVPCVLISFMTILGFLLPPDSGEKLTLQITILLSIVMFSLLISGIIPASSTALPTIVMYFATVMCMCSMSVVATVLVLGFHHRNAKNHTMPNWISVYINQYLAWLLWMNRPGHDLTWRAIRRRHTRSMERQNSTTSSYKCLPTPLLADSSKSLLANVTCLNDQPYTNNTSNTLPITVLNHVIPRQQAKCKNPNHHHEPNDVLLPRDMRVFRTEIRTIISELQFLTGHVKQEDEEDDISEDWKFSAMVIDRLCLVLFTIMTSIFSYITLFSAPNFFKLR